MRKKKKQRGKTEIINDIKNTAIQQSNAILKSWN